MYTATVILHLIVCFLMIAAILLQAGKGAEIGAAFGGSSQTVFGSRGPGTFLSKVTVAAAVIFMLTSLGLALLSKQENAASVIDVPATSGEATSSAPDGTEAVPETESPDASGAPAESSDAHPEHTPQ
ncbi:MAG: preprotein translocase subunit SecG [Nitrospira sp.]|nr:preprotein translocase subunit SecG [Nitrospira sp.]MDE0403879.1 preprotein translocase subunit SecG [Nitrospira sp.]MDE0485651.1 preprotein translocase subunit SecG [Nitrospira sp.]